MNLKSVSTPDRINFQRGVSMVEVLVALVVLGVGMLGIAGLYVASLKAERTAQLRTQAVTLVNDMVDRIRANAPARDAYDLQKTYAGAPVGQGCVAGVNNCSNLALAEDDLASWITAVKATLPAVKVADVKVDLAAATGRPDSYEVAIEWLEPGEKANFRYKANVSMIPAAP